jgi:NADPH:quinone reductase-like Zn-dependent oxidoreductase
MRAIVITKHGGPGVLQVQEQPDPVLGAGQVRIDVAAAGINFADVMARMGLYQDAPKTPCVVGYEVAGTVLELGDGVEGLTPGQRVFAGTQFGGYASQVIVPVGDVVPLPDGLSFEQGAAIPVNYANRVGRADRLRLTGARRARARALRRRWRRDRRDANRQAHRRRDLRNGLAR